MKHNSDYTKDPYKSLKDRAVSPVIGVMLMLIVTVIIASVVSSLSGGFMTSEKKAPTMMGEVRFVNTGEKGSFFSFGVLSVSEPIRTADLKIITSWRSNLSSNGTYVPGSLTGANTHVGSWEYRSPAGFGPGTRAWKQDPPYDPAQDFGNYTLAANTRLMASAYGPDDGSGGYGVEKSKPFVYKVGTNYTSSSVDEMQALFGTNWYELRQGDLVQVKVLHVPSGKVIFDREVPVEG